MRTRASLVWLAVLDLGLVIAGGCHSRQRRESPASDPIGAVGFELPGGGPVARGALLTQPPGHEEAFVPFVAVGASAWVDACRAEAGATPPLFTFSTDAHGTLRPAAADSGVTARDRCLAQRAVGSASPGLPAETRVTVQLALRGP
jgi:hypothetical protein